MPTGVALTSPSALPIAAAEVGRNRGAWSAAAPIAALGEARSAFRIDVEDREVRGRPRSTKRSRDRHARAAGAEEERRGQVAAPASPRRKLSAKPQQSVLCPIAPAALEDDRVDRADRRGVRRQLVEVRDDALLERMRDVEAGEAVALQPRQHGAEAGVGEAQLVEVEKRIRVVEAEPRALRLVHPRRPRFLDAAAEQAGAEHRLRQRLGSRGRSSACVPACALVRRHRRSAGSPATLLSPSRSCYSKHVQIEWQDCGRTSSYSQLSAVAAAEGRVNGRRDCQGARRRRSRINDPEGTKRNIIEVATQEFAENGLSGARIDEIAAKTKSSKRMIYYYFGDKEGLYLRVLEEAYSKVRADRGDARSARTCRRSRRSRSWSSFTFDHHNSQRGLHPPGDDREHPPRRIPGAIAGHPEAQRDRHRHGRASSTSAA